MPNMQKAAMTTDFTFISVGDIHISDAGPRSRIDNFKESILNKISQIRMAANKLSADGVILAGDLFDLKNPTRNSHTQNQELIKEFKQIKCPIYAIEGNHDLSENRLESLKEQPLGVLFADGTLIQLRDTVIEKNGVKISLIGLPYQEGFDPEKVRLPGKKDCVLQICALHIYSAPVPGMLFKNRIFGYKELMGLGPDIFILGHYHLDQGIERIEEKSFINLGAISRGTLAEENLDHKPKIGLIRISSDKNGKATYTIQSVSLKIKPVEEVFNLEKYKEEKKESIAMEAFVEKLITDTNAASSDLDAAPRNFEGVLNKMDIAKAVKDKVLHFMTEAKALVGKTVPV